MSLKSDLYKETFFRKIHCMKKKCQQCITKNYQGGYIKKTIFRIKAVRIAGKRCRDCKKKLQTRLTKEEKDNITISLENIISSIEKLGEVVITEYINKKGKMKKIKTWHSIHRNEEKNKQIEEEKKEQERLVLNIDQDSPIKETDFSEEDIIKMLEEAAIHLPTEEELDEIIKQWGQEEEDNLVETESLEEIKRELEETGRRFTYFCKEKNRLSSFENWPWIFLTPLELAAAGFYYTGEKDQVRCFCCNIILQDWLPGDKASVRHRESNQNCRLMKGEVCGNMEMKEGEDTCERYEEGYKKDQVLMIPEGQKCPTCMHTS